jgi:hypothetical protein
MYKKIVYLIILIALISCTKSPKCNSNHTISGQVLNGSTLQPIANIQMYLFCGFRGTSSEKIWEPITDKDGKYSITYNCNELSADSISVAIIEPENYCSQDNRKTQMGFLYHKANFDGVYNFYLATRGKICISVKEKLKGNLKMKLPQTIKLNSDPSYFIVLDSNSVGKFWTYSYKCNSLVDLIQGKDSNSINAKIDTKTTRAGCTVDPFIDTFVLTY